MDNTLLPKWWEEEVSMESFIIDLEGDISVFSRLDFPTTLKRAEYMELLLNFMEYKNEYRTPTNSN